MLSGQFRLALDEKGRLVIPTRIRTEIAGDSLVVTRGVDTCLWLFMPDDWKRISDSMMAAASPLASRARLIQRRIVAPAQEIPIDRAGRINLPIALIENVNLRRDCIVLGIKKYLELWDIAEYDAYLAASEEEFQAAAEELGGLVSF